MRRVSSLVVVLLVLPVVALAIWAYDDVLRAAGSGRQAERLIGSFPIGWFDTMDWVNSIRDIPASGIRTVAAYHTDGTPVQHYLDKAADAHVRVLVEIDRGLVNPLDIEGIERFVVAYRDHPALMGWYLADEPSITQELGPMTGETAKKIYAAIKKHDRKHPVAIAFHPVEPVWDYYDAMDVMMFDDYPCLEGKPEFSGFITWHDHTLWGALLSRHGKTKGFIPVLHAIAPDRGAPYPYRLCTATEERYMTFASIQAGATGVFYFARFYAPKHWIDQVLRPIVDDLRYMQPALAAGELKGKVTTGKKRVQASLYRDGPRYFLLVVNNSDGPTKTTVRIDPSIDVERGSLLSDWHPVDVADREIDVDLTAYQVQIYQLRS